ncbi:hypothetical protein SAMN05443287_11388 [Micromonospora phaseoli]|uniref:Uncharacterized protein n=1 Tax=Micromonospora phaseoli TaxID=1144548 RepID=A0A1H7DDW9_9ACTN|nr:hypothetical protein [Micromonospora phaseoli]PZV90510.1 hypothetical protein CLV64_11349 [Micromonospora phaseoli]GIJ78098.1 hypothetical protein Xph01_25300 [Micromonospora phaseoli]SEK00003.1 hypothetical protein SAMN05443287_11388 [Micromonospora phaseoli]
MGEQAVTGADGAPAPGSGGQDAAATGSPPPAGPATAGMTADGTAAHEVQVPGAGMAADAGGATGPQSRTTDIVPGPGGVMTDEVGVVTGELTLRTDFADGQVTLHVQYKDADEWYVVTGGKASLGDAAGLDAVHSIAVGLLNRPEG